MKKFTPHTMYNAKGEGFTVNTHEQHLSMKKKGYSHNKPSSKNKILKKARKRKY
jgi:hypothetical protein